MLWRPQALCAGSANIANRAGMRPVNAPGQPPLPTTHYRFDETQPQGVCSHEEALADEVVGGARAAAAVFACPGCHLHQVQQRAAGHQDRTVDCVQCCSGREV